MQIFTKGVIDRHQIEKEVGKKTAYDIMESQFKAEERKATDKWFLGRVDVGEARKNAKRLQDNLNKIRPETLSPSAQNIMWKRAKQLKDEFTVGMLSKDELHPVKSFQRDGKIVVVVDEERMHTSRCVERNSAWYTKNQHKIREFKNLMRHLCPDDPSAADIERFRPKRSA